MTEKTNIKQQIIDLVLADNYQPLKPRAIAKKLGLSSELIEVRRTIKTVSYTHLTLPTTPYV